MRDNQSGYLALDTIAALSTALGGAIAIVRVSGPTAFAVLDALTQAGYAVDLPPRKLARARLREPLCEKTQGLPLEGAHERAELDDALCARFVSPDTFTGEDLVELHVHGGTYVPSRVLEAALAAGARQALPGEFSFRAVRNGRLDLGQAQAVADLISAPNEGALALALEKLSGSQSRALTEISEGLRRVVVLSEAGIDFSDQDLDEVRLPKLKQDLAAVITGLEHLESSYDRGSRIQSGVRTAFLGQPNVGKSSLFNALLGEDRSIVSELPGTTRDVIREQLTLRTKTSSVTLRLEDTAGLRSPDDPIEREGIARTHRSAREADLVLFLVSAETEGANVAEQQWAELSQSSPLAEKTIGILTKSDLSDAARTAALAEQLRSRFGIARWVATSAIAGNGIDAMIEAITSFCELWSFRKKGEVLLTRLDHLEAARATLSHLKRALHAPALELFASDLRVALCALSPLIGETLPDDILGRIFSDFCIGK